jgi:hypothetical protein
METIDAMCLVQHNLFPYSLFRDIEYPGYLGDAVTLV